MIDLDLWRDYQISHGKIRTLRDLIDERSFLERFFNCWSVLRDSVAQHIECGIILPEDAVTAKQLVGLCEKD